MSFQIAFVLFLIVVFGLLLITEKLRPDLGALLLLVILGLTGLVNAEELFSGFSRSAVITIMALFIITRALEISGITRILGQHLFRLAGGQETRAILIIMTTTALLSLVMNTIAAAAVLLPAVIGITRQSNLKLSKLLIPLSFASLLGGMATVYTTANILVSSALAEQGFQPYGMLDFIPIGLPMAFSGILFIVFFGRRLLPDHGPKEGIGPRWSDQKLSETYKLADNISAVYVIPGSAMAGSSLTDAEWGNRFGLNVVGISRGGRIRLAPSLDNKVIEGDIILFTGHLDQDTAKQNGLYFTQDPDWEGQFITDQISLVEVVLAPRSTVAGKTLREINFREKFEFTILAIWREGTILREKLIDIPLKFGDTLLLQGRHSRINMLRSESNFLVLEEDLAPLESPYKAILTIGLTLLAVLLPAFNILPIAEAAFSVAILLVVFRCIDMDDAYSSIEWKAVFLIAGMLPLGVAMINSGAVIMLSDLLVDVLGRFGPLTIAGGIFLLATLLTQVMSGQATAVILAPIAIAASQSVGLDPRSITMAVAIGCSTAFLTPFGHATNLLVMGPGEYMVKDYFRVGWPLTLLLLVVFLFSLNYIIGF
jgi:di/tricarboxylate transporter